RRSGKATNVLEGSFSCSLIALSRLAKARNAPTKTISQTKAKAWRVARSCPSLRRSTRAPRADSARAAMVANRGPGVTVRERAHQEAMASSGEARKSICPVRDRADGQLAQRTATLARLRAALIAGNRSQVIE